MAASGKKNMFNEATRVQMPAMVHLTRLGYTYFGKITEDMAGTVYDPDTNILINVFKEQFARLNPTHAGEAEQTLKTIRQELDNDDIGRSFYERLSSVSPVRLVDFENPKNNTYHFTAEFTCKRDQDEFRPDITLFVNGLPLVFVEVKKPNNHGGMVAESKRMNQKRFPNKKFRRFLNITQLMIFSNNWISIICAVVALIVTVIIAVLQIRQSNRMERFEKRQDKRDEQRHQESVKAQAVSFISKYYKDRGLIPLCAIATMYNDLFYYNREMYREFCCCTKEVQNRILEYCGLDLRVSEYSIYEKCLVAIESVLNKRFPDDKSVFYDGGKYFTRSLEYYAAKPIPHQEFEYQNHITDVLANAFNSNDKKATPIQQLSVEYNFESCEGIETCQLVTVIAEFSAIYGNKNKNIDKSYGSPGGYDGEVIETMEDLFLLALFEIYTNCVL